MSVSLVWPQAPVDNMSVSACGSEREGEEGDRKKWGERREGDLRWLGRKERVRQLSNCNIQPN